MYSHTASIRHRYRPFSRGHQEADYSRLSRSRSPVSRDSRYRRSRSREPSPSWFACGRRAERRRAEGRMFNEYRRSPSQQFCSQFDTSRGYGAFSSFSEQRYPPRREENEFVNRQYNCTADRTEWTRRFDLKGKMKWPPRRNLNWIGKNGNFSLSNTADDSNVPPSPVICSFYNAKKTCGKGDLCKFIHICKHFIDGDCKYNKLCKRSHDIFGSQSKRLLQMYNLIPDDPLLIRSNKGDIIASVKKELRKVKSTLSATTLPTPFRPLLDEESYLLREKSSPADTDTPSDVGSETGSTCEPISSPEVDWSNVNQSDDAEEQVEQSENFIPLETNSKTGTNGNKDNSKKQKKRKGDSKASKGKLQGGAIKLEPVEENWSDASDTDIDLTITFEYQHPERRFLVRQTKNKWKVSNLDGEWEELSVDESEIFNKLSYKGLEIGDKALPRY